MDFSQAYQPVLRRYGKCNHFLNETMDMIQTQVQTTFNQCFTSIPRYMYTEKHNNFICLSGTKNFNTIKVIFITLLIKMAIFPVRQTNRQLPIADAGVNHILYSA